MIWPYGPMQEHYSMNTAIIDLGTNTFNLLIGRIEEGRVVTEFKTKIPVKLGKGGFAKRHLTEDAIARGLLAIESHINTAQEHGVESIVAFATSAVRDASNGADFVRQIQSDYGLQVQVISGNREAELICEGVRSSSDFGAESLLIMDIGGGSTEFILTSVGQIHWKKSYALGVSRLLERIQPSDPLGADDLDALHSILDDALTDLGKALELYPAAHLVGSSGSFDTMADLILAGIYKEEVSSKGNRYDFRLNDFETIYTQLRYSTQAERLAMPGMLEMRAEMMVLSSSIIRYVVQRWNMKQVTLSTYALKEGALVQHYRNKK